MYGCDCFLGSLIWETMRKLPPAKSQGASLYRSWPTCSQVHILVCTEMPREPPPTNLPGIALWPQGREGLALDVNKLQRPAEKGKLIRYIWKEVKGHLITGGRTICSEVHRWVWHTRSVQGSWNLFKGIKLKVFWLRGVFFNFRICGMKFCWLWKACFLRRMRK